MTSLLEIHDLTVQAGAERILDVPDLSIQRGEVLVVLGPNGAGKSTLLLAAAGLQKPSTGSIFFSHSPNLPALSYRRKISTVFQSPLLLNDTVENNIASGLRFRGIASAEIKQRTQLWMDRLNISHLAKRRSNTLSGGEAQRVSLARAFCLETEIILMDEPFSALDSPTRQSLMNDLRSIFTETRQTCIYVTHDLEEAMSIGDRVAVFIKGKMHQVDSVQAVFTHPGTPETAAFVGVDTIIAGQVVSCREGLVQVQANGCLLEAVAELPLGSQVFICLRPEDITLYPADQEIKPSSARNRLTCQITRLLHQGPFIRVQLDAGFPLTALITRPSAQEMNLEVGKEMVALFKASAIHLIPAGKPEGPRAED